MESLAESDQSSVSVSTEGPVIDIGSESRNTVEWSFINERVVLLAVVYK